ncbi:hypothetical protein BDN70DRAFT_921891, partial [Pholiota conissans]
MPSALSPIHKLDDLLLWRIFTFNNTLYHGPQPEDKWQAIQHPVAVVKDHDPLTTTRQCSQVCEFWRDIILSSPYIWSFIDLESLVQENDAWRNEVLRRSGGALLTIHGRCMADIPQNFLRKLLRDYWNRIQVIDVQMSTFQFRNGEIIAAIGHPAPHLRAFVVLSALDNTNVFNEEEFPFFPDFDLFGGEAPSLVCFSIAGNTFHLVYHTTIAMLSSMPIRELTLNSAGTFTCTDVLSALAEMPHLEALSLGVALVIQDDQLGRIVDLYLPHLKRLSIIGFHPMLYSAFLERIIPHPACALMPHSIPPFLNFYLPLKSVEVLYTAPRDLAHMMQWAPEGTVLFPKLSVVAISFWNSRDDNLATVKSFLIARTIKAPIQLLIIPLWESLSDLQLFDDLPGLTIIMRCGTSKEGQRKIVEYTCGSGSTPVPQEEISLGA